MTKNRRADRIRPVIEATFASWREHRTVRMGAGLSYYALFGVVPLLSLSIYLAGLAFSTEEVRRRVLDSFGVLLGDRHAAELAGIVGDVVADSAAGSSGLIGLITLVVTSGLLLAALQDAMDLIFETPVERRMLDTYRRRVSLLALVMVLACTVLASLLLETVVRAVLHFLAFDLLAALTEALLLSTRVISLGMVTLAVALLYRLLPRNRPPWRTALGVAVLATAIGALATVAVGVYLRTIGSTSLEGATGGLVLVLTLVFALCQVFLAGAELVRTLASAAPAGPAPDVEPSQPAADRAVDDDAPADDTQPT